MNFLKTAPAEQTEARDGDQFEVFFDGECPLCKREIDMIRRKDTCHQLLLTDIADPSFISDEIPLETLMRQIHGRHPDGRFVTGVDVFREIYQRIGFGSLVKTSRLPVIRQFLNLGYFAFAKIRFYSAMRRLKNRNLSCNLPAGSSVSKCERPSV
jgi:predicted DCC family thiol-disulfide oxidoreductase YuxK